MSVSEIERLKEEMGELLASQENQRAAVDFAKYRDDPIGFAREVLNERILWDAQLGHLALLATEKRVAAYGANGCGKTRVDAIAALWFLYCHDGRVVATSTVESQLRHQYMADVRTLFLQSKGALPGQLYTMGVRRAGVDKCDLHCLAASDPNNLRSFHAERMMVQLQEAQGLPDWAYQTAEMMAVGNADIISLTGNSGQTGGTFHQRCLSPHWHSIRYNSEEHPNIREGRPVIPGGPTLESIRQRAVDYGISSGFYISSVLGLFPTDSVDSLTTREELERAFLKHEKDFDDSIQSMSLPVHLAWDVALRGVDLNAVATVQGLRIREIHTWSAQDMNPSYQRIEDLAGAANEAWSTPQHRRLSQKRAANGESISRPTLVIDEAGMGGPAVDECRKRGYHVVGFIGAASPRKGDRFLNLRAESYFLVRQGLQQGRIALPRDTQLAEELLAVEWTTNNQDKIQLIAKDDIRKKLNRSPDKSDCVTMGLWHTLRQEGRGNYGSSRYTTY